MVEGLLYSWSAGPGEGTFSFKTDVLQPVTGQGTRYRVQGTRHGPVALRSSNNKQ